MSFRIGAWKAGAAVVALVAALMAGPVEAQGPKSAERLALKSSSALVLDQASGEVLYGKNPDAVVPIASLTKLMTAMVVLDSGLDPDERIRITEEDVDVLKGTTSRLRVGSVLTRDELLRLTLMASENRAASALARAHPGGREAFVAAMNRKAAALGLRGTHYVESTGLSSANVSTAQDLAVIADAAMKYDRIREYSTMKSMDVRVGGRTLTFRNTNGLVANPHWDIGLSKTGFIREAGRCLVMQARLAGRAVIIVLLDSWGKYTRLGDANRIRQWIEAAAGIRSAHAASPARKKSTTASRKTGRSG